MLTKGSALQRPGASYYANSVMTGAANVVVASGANTKGIIVRTVIMAGNDAATWSIVQAGTSRILQGPNSAGGAVFSYVGPGILIPPGQALSVGVTGTGNAIMFMSYDVLT